MTLPIGDRRQFLAAAAAVLLACGGGGGQSADDAGTGGGSGGGEGGGGGTQMQMDSGSGGGMGGGTGGGMGASDSGSGGNDAGGTPVDAGPGLPLDDAGIFYPTDGGIPNVGRFSAVADDRQVYLSWNMPTGSYSVVVKRDTTAAPTSLDAGVQVYIGNGTSVTDIGRTNGTTYYYTAFTRGAAGTATGVSASATPSPAAVNSQFYGYIEASALTVPSGGSLTFTGRAVNGTGPFTYEWTFQVNVGQTASGPGPHTPVFEQTANGTVREVVMKVTDTATGEQWQQKIFIVIGTSDAGSITPVVMLSSATVGQGGTIEVNASMASSYTVHSGNTGVSSGNMGHLQGDLFSYPWAGTFSATVVGSNENPINAYGTVTQSVTVTPEPSGGTLSTGVRIGPLQGISGCYYCNAYVDNRIAVRLASNGSDKLIALFDQKARAADRDDSIIAAVFNGTAWLPYTDVDVTGGRRVSNVSLGEGNPEYMHQLDVAMAANGDAIAVFTQQAETVPPVKPNPSTHVFANVYRGGQWLGAQRLGQEPDNFSNRSKEPQVVVWNDGDQLRGVAVWQQNANGGPEKAMSARFNAGINGWDAGVAITNDSQTTGGFDSVDLAASPNGKVFLVYEDNGTVYGRVSPSPDGGLWTAATTLLANADDDMAIEVKASANGTAMVLLANADDRSDNVSAVYAVRHDGTSWGTVTQIGDDTNLASFFPAAWGATWSFKYTTDSRLAVDSAGNAVAVFVPYAQSDTMHYGIAAVSAYYSATTGMWSAFAPITDTSESGFELVLSGITQARENENMGLSLNDNGVGLLSYAAKVGQEWHAFTRKFTAASNTWSARSRVDDTLDEQQTSSRVIALPSGGGMVVYENWPRNSKSAGSVKARQLAP